ncbi:MAG: type II toxin-antitoxin system HicB family antitoxin [Bacillota bacterium]
MNNMLEYKGYVGTIEISGDDEILFGKVIGVNSLLSYEGESVAELKSDFEGVIDEYLEMCAEKGVQPEKFYKGSFNVRVNPDLHKKVARYSALVGKTMNAVVEDAIRSYVE